MEKMEEKRNENGILLFIPTLLFVFIPTWIFFSLFVLFQQKFLLVPNKRLLLCGFVLQQAALFPSYLILKLKKKIPILLQINLKIWNLKWDVFGMNKWEKVCSKAVFWDKEFKISAKSCHQNVFNVFNNTLGKFFYAEFYVQWLTNLYEPNHLAVSLHFIHLFKVLVKLRNYLIPLFFNILSAQLMYTFETFKSRDF